MTKNTTGFLVINKAAGLTSHDVVGEIRTITDIKRVGHTGTLDPFATGVLIIPIGPATRLMQYTHDLPKAYQASITLGATSDTDDITGKITTTSKTSIPTKEDVEKVLEKFSGEIEQIPPTYAAIKIDGKKLYEYAREGKEVEKKPRNITIYSLTLIDYKYPIVTIEATVSAGTYIRSLGRDIGQALQIGAYVSQLHRNAIGSFTDKQAVELKSLKAENWLEYLHDAKELVAHLPSLILNNKNITALQQGKEIICPKHMGSLAMLAILNKNQAVMGVVEYNPETSTLKAKTIFPY